MGRVTELFDVVFCVCTFSKREADGLFNGVAVKQKARGTVSTESDD